MIEDQASALRRKVMNSSPEEKQSEVERENQFAQTRTLAISGGKGGVGKSNISLNLAVSLGKMNYRVMLMDTDFGLPNLDVLLGCVPDWNITDIMRGLCEPDAAVNNISPGVDLIAGGELWGDDLPSRQQIRSLLSVLSAHMANSEYMLIDTPAGVAPAVTSLLLASEMVIVITTPEPPSMMDSYRTIKHLNTQDFDGEIAVVVNRATKRQADRVFRNLQQMVGRFLDTQVKSLTWIPDDPAVGRAVRKQVPLIDAFPKSKASRAVQRLAEHLVDEPQKKKEPAKAFLTKLGQLLPGLSDREGR